MVIKEKRLVAKKSSYTRRGRGLLSNGIMASFMIRVFFFFFFLNLPLDLFMVHCKRYFHSAGVVSRRREEKGGKNIIIKKKVEEKRDEETLNKVCCSDDEYEHFVWFK